MDPQDFDPDDPDRHLKRLGNVIGVSNRIKKLTSKKRQSLKLETKEEKIEKILKSAKEERGRRNLQIGSNARYLVEMASLHFCLDEDTVFEFAIDSAANVKTINDLFERDGTTAVLIQYQPDDPPALESGRYNPSLNGKKVDSVLFTNGKGKKTIGKSVVAYRLQNTKAIDPKTVQEEIYFNVLPADENVIGSIFSSLSETIRPALEASKEYGTCTETAKTHFIHGNDHFLGFLKSTRNNIKTSTIQFEVSHELFKGFLLAPHQIEATSKRRDKVAEVERAFRHWMKQIKVVVWQGHQLVGVGTDDGTQTEIEHWRKMLTMFSNVVEFTDSRPFRNYLKCLKLSRSKLVNQWKNVDQDLILLLNEARDNLRFMSSIEKFWYPLYCSNPLQIAESILNLFQAIRSVFNTSRFYNTTLRVTSLLSKVVNQLIIASQLYLTNNNKIKIWDEKMSNLVKKLHECKELNETFRESYRKVLAEMAEAGERSFGCSEHYLFDRMKSFEIRLSKIREIMEICLRYQVLDRVQIGGTETFSERIKAAFKTISEKPNDALAHRMNEFNDDYENFQKDLNIIELEMEAFVKNYVAMIETVDMRLLTLKRFARLKLDCLHLDRRYLDVAVMLEKEIENIKDKYNEERADPPIGRNVPPVVGRILWARTLLKKMEDPLNVLKAHDCLITHPKAQPCVKNFNCLAEILFHYEAMHHKSWFTYVSQVRSKLEKPLIKKNPETNHYELNLDPYVLQAITETESMFKLGLEVPDSIKILVYCKHRVIDAFDTMKHLVARNDELRKSIYPMFVPLMRIQLIKLERVFAPALSTVTWLSQNHDEYFEEIANVLLAIENFVKEISDINDAQIERMFDSIENMILIYLPEGAVTPQELKELNDEHRQNIEKEMKIKSLVAENGAIELINKFVEKSGVPDYDESGKFQLPPDKITDINWRVEETKPIDKYDWLSFEKLYKPVGYAAPEENEQFCFKEYDGLKYDVTLLHIDCVELFAYYNHKIIASLVTCTKRSMELYKKRSNISGQILTLACGSYDEKSLVKAAIELRIPHFTLVPKMPEIQKFYDAVLLNIIETHYAVPTWGKQAKTEERKKRKPLLEEVRHERSWFKMISEHKDIMRYKLSFDNGVMQLDVKMKSILMEFYDKYNYLWQESRVEEIEGFVKGNPLTADIRDKFLYYDSITKAISKLNKIYCVRTIEIDCEHAIYALIEESKAWKVILGSKLSAFYRTILHEMATFIQAQQKMLTRNLEDLEDCRITMDCLKVIRDNCIWTDQNISLMEETYSMFTEFQINIPPEDTERADGLRHQFNTLINTADSVNQEVQKAQGTLRQELDSGVEKFRIDLGTYDEEFKKRGPLVLGTEVKEASDRVELFQIRLMELQRLHEIYSSGEQMFGLPVNQYPLLREYSKNINFLSELYKLYLDVLRAVAQYSGTLFREIDTSIINQEVQDFVKRCEALPNVMQCQAYLELKQKIADLNEICPLFELMSSNAIRDRHWTNLELVTAHTFEFQSDNFTIGDVLEAPLLEFKEEIKEICLGAIKEQQVEIEMKGVIKDWKDVNLKLDTFKNRGELMISEPSTLAIISKLKKSLVTMEALEANPFNVQFKKDIMLNLERLTNTKEILEKWLLVQNLWLSMENVFVGKDISRELPLEAKRFLNLDKAWVRILYKARDTPNLLEICTGDDIVETTLKFLLEQLEACQQAVAEHLEAKPSLGSAIVPLQKESRDSI